MDSNKEGKICNIAKRQRIIKTYNWKPGERGRNTWRY